MGGKNSGSLFNNWLKNFATTVFTQSFHAFFMVFIITSLSKFHKPGTETNEGIVAIITIVLTMALIKFEKLIKSLFGINDGMLGDIKSNGMMAIGGVKAAANMGKTISEPFKKHAEAKRKVDRLGKKLSKTEGIRAVGKNGDDLGIFNNGIHNDKYAIYDENSLNNTHDDGINENSEFIASQNDNNSNSNISNTKGNISKEGVATGENSAQTNQLLSQLIAISKQNVTETAKAAKATERANDEKKAEKIESLVDEYNDALLQKNVSSRDRWLNSASAIAGTSIGLGMADDIEESAMIGALINKPLAVGTTKIAERSETKKAYNATKNDKYETESIKKAIASGLRTNTGNRVINNSTSTSNVTNNSSSSNVSNNNTSNVSNNNTSNITNNNSTRDSKGRMAVNAAIKLTAAPINIPASALFGKTPIKGLRPKPIKDIGNI